MVLSLGFVFMALRYGLAVRMRRMWGRPSALDHKTLRRRHVRVGKIAVSLVSVGFAAGLSTTTLWLGDRPLSTFHGLIAVLALSSFVATAVLGHRLETGHASARESHAWAAFAATLLAAAGAVAGFVLLP